MKNSLLKKISYRRFLLLLCFIAGFSLHSAEKKISKENLDFLLKIPQSSKDVEEYTPKYAALTLEYEGDLIAFAKDKNNSYKDRIRIIGELKNFGNKKKILSAHYSIILNEDDDEELRINLIKNITFFVFNYEEIIPFLNNLHPNKNKKIAAEAIKQSIHFKQEVNNDDLYGVIQDYGVDIDDRIKFAQLMQKDDDQRGALFVAKYLKYYISYSKKHFYHFDKYVAALLKLGMCQDVITILIENLKSDSYLFRRHSLKTLRRLTDINFKLDFENNWDDRVKTIYAWEEWWKENKSKVYYNLETRKVVVK